MLGITTEAWQLKHDSTMAKNLSMHVEKNIGELKKVKLKTTNHFNNGAGLIPAIT